MCLVYNNIKGALLGRSRRHKIRTPVFSQQGRHQFSSAAIVVVDNLGIGSMVDVLLLGRRYI